MNSTPTSASPAARSRRASAPRRCLTAAADRRPQRSGNRHRIVGYLTENFGFSVFVLDDGAVYQTYSAGARGVEFLMGYYPILDRAPNGRDEGDGFQLWFRRHDEYETK